MLIRENAEEYKKDVTLKADSAGKAFDSSRREVGRTHTWR